MGHRIELTWPGGEHVFALPIGGLRAVQDALNEGPMQTLSGLMGLTCKVDAPFAVLRHGLIGGGMSPDEAKRIVLAAAEMHPWTQFLPPAAQVLRAALIGVADDPVGSSTTSESDDAGETPGAPAETPNPAS